MAAKLAALWEHLRPTGGVLHCRPQDVLTARARKTHARLTQVPGRDTSIGPLGKVGDGFQWPSFESLKRKDNESIDDQRIEVQ